MRAQRREVRWGSYTLPTPIVIPSFSSRAKPPMALSEMASDALSSIVGPVLVSAYDIAHEPQLSGYDFAADVLAAQPAMVILDSGGYEALWNLKAKNAKLIEAQDARDWTPDLHRQVLDGWSEEVPTIAVTFDIPEHGPGPIEQQVAAGLELADRYRAMGVELLLKPPDPDALLLAADVAPQAGALGRFAMIGVTEDEIGGSMVERLEFISELRTVLDDAGLHTPVHVFGGLDPVMTPLYFLAGADAFDGLSWLRYAYDDGRSIYAKSAVASEFPLVAHPDAYGAVRRRNIRALTDLQISMSRFLMEGSLSVFGRNAERLGAAWAAMGGTRPDG